MGRVQYPGRILAHPFHSNRSMRVDVCVWVRAMQNTSLRCHGGHFGSRAPTLYE